MTENLYALSVFSNKFVGQTCQISLSGGGSRGGMRWWVVDGVGTWFGVRWGWGREECVQVGVGCVD